MGRTDQIQISGALDDDVLALNGAVTLRVFHARLTGNARFTRVEIAQSDSTVTLNSKSAT